MARRCRGEVTDSNEKSHLHLLWRVNPDHFFHYVQRVKTTISVGGEKNYELKIRFHLNFLT